MFSNDAACAAHPTADVFINFASFRSASASSLAALKQPTIRVVDIIAEGVPESDTKQLIAYEKENNKVLIGPATVGGIQAGAFRIGDTAGTIDNVIQCKLYRLGSVGFVSKPGGMSNEMYNTIARVTDGIYEGIAIGGDVFPGSTLSDHVLRLNNIPQAAAGKWVTEECKKSFMEMKWKKVHRYIVFKFDDKSSNLTLDKVGGPNESYNDLAASLPKDGCRYVVFDFNFVTIDNCWKSKILFIAWVYEEYVMKKT